MFPFSAVVDVVTVSTPSTIVVAPLSTLAPPLMETEHVSVGKSVPLQSVSRSRNPFIALSGQSAFGVGPMNTTLHPLAGETETEIMS